MLVQAEAHVTTGIQKTHVADEMDCWFQSDIMEIQYQEREVTIMTQNSVTEGMILIYEETGG
jgi:hypothetical protein